jgi:glycerophosphoryl diester phosphodiesterase
MIRSLLKYIVFLVLILVLIYIIIILYEGGFGQRIPVILPVKYQDAALLFAHRGVTVNDPENSREAIEQARSKGFKGLEVDIRRSADKEFILFHDEHAKRLLRQENKIADMTLGQIREYKLLTDHGTSSGIVLTLDEMLDEYSDDFIIYIDMKLGGLADVRDLISVLQAHELSRTVIVASPSLLVILYIEFNFPAIQTAMEGFNAGNEWAWHLIPRNLKPDFLSGFASKVNTVHIEWLNKHGLVMNRIVYGVDSTNYQSMLDLGLKNMIIDYYPALPLP